MGIKVCNIRLDKQHLESDLKNLNAFLDTVSVKLTSSNFVSTATKDYWSVLIYFEPNERKVPVGEVFLDENEKETYQALKNWRSHKATELNLKQYLICSNTELMHIASRKPKNIDELRTIRGFGAVKTEKFGEEILSLFHTKPRKRNKKKMIVSS
ncbi:aldolase [Flavobacterium sp. CYK-4]|uniref:HRDC domain-containing protein n=1 Tax=Flavobacterium lotistagni TaxID=2709660 RepID=UPI00140735AC|nr:HRDC domain-containing protein [Flavobacterium lotistagni]NHM07823.1 aldolase [Flavobacterium lotistagni]